MSDDKYDVYISSSSRERDFAGRLSQSLRGNGFSVYSFLDVLVGESWEAVTTRALLGSRFVVAVLSEGSVTSIWAQKEWARALEREQAEGRVVVLPVRLDNYDVPAELARKLWIDLRDWVTPERFNEGVTALIRSMGQLSQPAEAGRRSADEPSVSPLAVPPDLIQSCMTGECVLFAGAGLSARCGVPVWDRFLLDLLDFASGHNTVEADYAQSLRAALREGERSEAADGIVQGFGGDRQPLQTFLQEYYSGGGEIGRTHRLLQQIPFASLITTNYDRLLEETFPEYAANGLFTPKDAEPLLDALAQKRRFLLKLYGQIERQETLIFAPFEYREALTSNISFARFMEGIFFSRTFLFLGLSLDGIQDFLSGFLFRGVSPRKHFALVAVSGRAWKTKCELLLRRYNIEVIPFAQSAEFSEVDTFVEELSRAVRPAGAGAPASPAEAPALPGLRRLVLEDIGPFERLELDFPKGQNWKVLLGDNGVGKSTILKAIAVAIIGPDAKSFAARLVRTGKTLGRITLHTEHNPSGYITEILTKDMLSEAEVLSRPSRPMEAEGWLALGFSPLRLVTWSPSTGPQPIVQKGRPTADDLLPLISGEADPRMDRLKQWIVNLDSADKPGRVITLAGHQARVRSIQFAPDGRTLISGSIDKTVRFWDCWTGAETGRIAAHSAGVNSIALSGDGKVLATGSYDRTAKTWNVANRGYIRSFEGSFSQILAVTLSADGETLVTGSESGSVRIWGRDGRELRKVGATTGKWSLALSPGAKVVAAGSYSGHITFIEAATGAILRTIHVGRGCVMGLAWLPDGGRIACASKNGPVNLFDAATGDTRKEFAGTDTYCVAVSPDGRTLAAGFENGEVKAWDIDSEREVLRVHAHPQPVWSVAFSPDGRVVASGSEDRTIKIFNLPGTIQSGAQQETIRRFFRLIGKLTDRTDIDFLKVTDDYHVMIRVADATAGVPLELLSQGMTSLFGWVGVLCQRLKETLQAPTQDPLPVESYALVLIDELDAHMHPRWQQVLVERLKKVFPNAQFIASTHSPLIVGGLAKSEVDRFTMRHHQVAKVDFDSDMTLGRTDQVLTGSLFGLETTLDTTTQSYMTEYEELLGEPERNETQEARFQELGAILEARIPPSPPDLVGRRAGELLEALRAEDGSAAAREGEAAAAEDSKYGPRVRERMAQLAKVLRGEA